MTENTRDTSSKKPQNSRKFSFLCHVPKEYQHLIRADELVRYLAKQVGGGGGGNAGQAAGGGPAVGNIQEILDSVYPFIEEKIRKATTND